eukprot:19248_1
MSGQRNKKGIHVWKKPDASNLYKATRVTCSTADQRYDPMHRIRNEQSRMDSGKENRSPPNNTHKIPRKSILAELRNDSSRTSVTSINIGVTFENERNKNGKDENDFELPKWVEFENRYNVIKRDYDFLKGKYESLEKQNKENEL